jgi:nucleoid-associated protein YgaU
VGLLGKLFGGGSKKEEAAPAKPSKTIKVGPGETLKKIAEREYGDANQWEKIYKANKWKIDDPEMIYPGMDLLIP